MPAGQAAPVFETPLFLQVVSTQLKERIETKSGEEGFVCRGEPICGIQLIPAFYQQRNFAPVWFDDHGLRSTIYALIRAIQQTSMEGLHPRDYHLEPIESLLAEMKSTPFPPNMEDAGHWADLDLILTDALLLLGSHLSGGRINPETFHTDWRIAEPAIDMRTVLHASVTETQLEQTIDALRPYHVGYHSLRNTLQHLRLLAADGGWPQIQQGPTLRPAERDPRVPIVRQRLQISGDLPHNLIATDPEIYDADLVAAVQHFQQRHGLRPDGIIGRQTLAALNVATEQRIRQIELNLERWRWLPHDLGWHHIMVNTADFSLQVVNNQQTVLKMRVVVGRPARRTPVFSAQMTYLVLNPYWTVPPTIAIEDILPRLVAGENYLAQQGMQVLDGWDEDAAEIDPQTIDWSAYHRERFPFQLRQAPGPLNALGKIKFMFPNKFAVYLHDTPQRALFNNVQRDFSSGCIRVENPLALTAYLLRNDPAWTEEKLKRVLQENSAEKVIPLKDPIPIHLLYITAWVDEDGTLQFRNDIYDRDKALDAALRQRLPRERPQQVTTQRY